MKTPAILSVLMFFSALLSAGVAIGQQSVKEVDGYKVITGERPPVNYQQLPADAYEPGEFIVKFSESLAKQLSQNEFTTGDNGFIKTGMADFDQLCTQFKVTAGRSMLAGLYEIPGKHNDYRERHKAWGFDRWYDFTSEFRGDMIRLIEAFNALEGVEQAEPRLKIKRIEPVGKQPLPEGGTWHNPKWTPDDPSYGLQWNLENTGQTVSGMPGTAESDVNVQPAWDIAKGSPDVVVAVFDGGIKFDHEDLAGNMWPGIGPDGASTVADDHGTSVAGIISAVSNNSTGIAGIAGGSGIDDGARLMSLDIYSGSHGLTTMELYMYAADNGAVISQNSWGYTNPDAYNTTDLYGIDYFNANGGGDVMDGGITIFAAGNDGDDQNWYPGFYTGTVAVAATDNNDIRAYFSSYGSYVELSAPGLNVPSTGITAGSDDYYLNSGTSFSSPHASGVAALMLAMAPGKFTPQQLRDMMKASADNIDYLNPAFAGQIGAGRINATAALQAVQDMIDGLENPAAFHANSAGPTQINLNWTKNDQNQSVMVVFTTDNNFGTPANGSVYNPGDNIPGGGTVIYRGDATSYLHTALEPNTVYFYRAYSYNSSNHYASGRKANAETETATSAESLFHETFEADSPTRASWTQIQEAGSANWTFATGSSGGSITSAYQGSLNARFVSENGTNSPITKLVTPVIDISGLTSPEVDFWYGQEVWYGDQNELKVYYRTSGANPWVQIAHYTTDVNTWTDDVIALPNPSSTYQIAFEGINNWGHANVLDEVIVREEIQSASATYTAGDISTDFPFDPSGVSTCPGSLTVNIPAGAVITGVDVAYDMTAATGAWMSEQRSRLVCTSTGGKYEPAIYSGTGDATGTMNYSRSGLDIANEVTGGGNITFELHALRTWQGGGNCNTTYNKVDNSSWTVTVHYYVPLPSVIYTAFSATTSGTGSRNLDDVHISTSHPDGIASGALAPRIYWRVNAGTWNSASVSSVNGNLYDFVIGTTGLSNGDAVEYFVIAESVSGDIVAQPGAGLVATDVNTITTYPSNPHSYTVTNGPLAGDYTVGTAKFNQLSGKNITFKKVTNTVMKAVWAADDPAQVEDGKIATSPRGGKPEPDECIAEATHRANGKYEWMETEEITWVPMENGKVYEGSLYVENPDKSKGIKGVYATLTAAIADLNSRGVSGAVNFLLTDASYSTGETFPLEINVTSEHKPGAGKPVTIRPDASVTATISGPVDDDAIFRVIDTDYLTIDGSNSGGSDRSLTIQNTSTTFPEVVLIGSSGTTPVVGSGVKNCNISNGSQSSSAVVVTAADGSAGYFNNITIQNNDIQKAYIGLFCNAAVSPGNGSGLLIADNDLDESGANSVRLVGIYVQGAEGATVSGNTVSNISNTLAEAIRGIWFATGTVTGTITGNTVSNLTKTVTSADAAITGIYITPGTAAKEISITGNTISNLTNTGTLATFAGISNLVPNVTITGNTITTLTQNTNAASIWGIVSSGASSVEVSGNDVSDISTATTGTPNGISIQGNSTTVQVFNNRISNIKNTNTGGYSAVGLALDATSTIAGVLVYNNFIRDVAGYGWNSTTDRNGYGIRINSGGGYRLYHNSVHLATGQTATTGIPACLIIASGLGADALDIRNNIFSMAATVGTDRCAVISNSANTVFSAIDYNDYYISGGHIGYIGGANQTTLANWQTGTGQDANSTDAMPDFVSSTDLHISGGFSSPLAGLGSYLHAVIDDIDGDLRSDPPFIGADEYSRSWTGSVSSVWNNSSNWNPGVPASAVDAVRIPSGVPNFPEISAAATCGYLLIDEGAEVAIAPGGSLTVSEKMVNNAGKDKLVIKSDNSGTGSLLHYTSGVEATVERYIPASGYHLVSVPVTQASGPVSGWFLWSYLYAYDVASQAWNGMGGDTADPLEVNRGYMIYKYPGPAKWDPDTTYAIKGILNSGTFYADVSYPGVSGNHSLVPNPYPSAIDWNAASGWSRTNLAGSYWMWIHSSNNYGVWNGTTGTHGVTKDIPVGQAYFVQATAADPVLATTGDVRLHSSQAFYKTKDELQNLLRLNASCNGMSDEIVVLFDDEASADYMSQEDASKMYGGAEAPQLYSHSADDRKLTINMLPLKDEKMEIPVGFEQADPGEIVLVAGSLETFDQEIAIHLLDRHTGAMTDLRAEPQYTFTHHPDNPANRFDLIFKSAVGIDELQTLDALAYFYDGWLHLDISDEITGTSTVHLYNVDGQLVLSSLAQPGKSAIALPAMSSGVYMIQLINEQGVFTRKAFNR